MPTFLILQSPNKGNVGTTTQREDGFYKPTFYQISDSELEQYNGMNAHAKAAFIAEKLEAQMGTPIQVKKKVAPIVELAERVEEPVLVKIPDVEFEPLSTFDESEKINEPINETENDLDSKFVEAISIEEPKAKGRPKKLK